MPRQERVDPVNARVEAICECGCEVVRATIKALKGGQPVAQVAGLDTAARARVLAELEAVMAVYDAR